MNEQLTTLQNKAIEAQQDFMALMVTDTAPFRYPDYHLPTDTPDKLDFARTARVVEGIEAVVRELAE